MVRPKRFTDLIGQPFAQGVGSQIGKGVISGQGYILAGPKGCGKTTVARIISAALNCENVDTDTGNPCGTCSSCMQISKNSHPGVEEINAAAYRGINEMKEKLSSMRVSLSSGWRVYIIDEAHLLTKDAFSVLLKPIEEPPENVMFILTTTDLDQIPETILSRLPLVPLVPLSDDDLEKVATRAIDYGKKTDPNSWGKISDDDISRAVATASGSARQLITSLSSVVFHGVSADGEFSGANNVARLICDGDVSGTLSEAFSQLSGKGIDIKHFVLLVSREIIKLFSTGDYPAQVAYAAAHVGEIYASLSVSSSAAIVAPRLSYCASIAAGNQGETESGEKLSQGDTKVEVKEKKKNPLQREVKTLDDILAVIDDNAHDIPGRWLSILDDEEASDIYIGIGGTPHFNLPHPTGEIEAILDYLFPGSVVKDICQVSPWDRDNSF